MNETEPARNVSGALLPFSFTGRIGPVRYWAHVAGAVAVLMLSIFLLAIAMDPRGTIDPAFLVFLLFGLFVWLIAAAIAQRLRDAGKPPALVLVFIVLLLGMLFLASALIETAPLVGLAGFAAVLAFVGHIDGFLKRKADPT